MWIKIILSSLPSNEQFCVIMIKFALIVLAIVLLLIKILFPTKGQSYNVIGPAIRSQCP